MQKILFDDRCYEGRIQPARRCGVATVIDPGGVGGIALGRIPTQIICLRHRCLRIDREVIQKRVARDLKRWRIQRPRQFPQFSQYPRLRGLRMRSANRDQHNARIMKGDELTVQVRSAKPRDRTCNHTGLVAEEIIRDKIEGSSRFFIVNRRSDPG